MKTLGIRIDLGRLLTSLTGLVARSVSSTDARQATAEPPAPAIAIPVPLEPGSLWRVDGRMQGLRVRCDHSSLSSLSVEGFGGWRIAQSVPMPRPSHSIGAQAIE